MRSTKKLKDFAGRTLSSGWIGATAQVWLWEAVFVVPAIFAYLEARSRGSASPIYLLVVLVAAGPTTYLLQRYFYRLVNFTVIHSDRRLLRIAAAYVRSLIGLVVGWAVVYVGCWFVDTVLLWTPVLLGYFGVNLSAWETVDWAATALHSPLWWPLVVVLGALLPVSLSPMNWLLMDEPHAQLLGSLRRSLELIKGHRNEYIQFLLSFFGWIVVVGGGGVALVAYARKALDDYFGLQPELWVYVAALAIAAGPLIAYILTALVAYYFDLKEEYEDLHRARPVVSGETWAGDEPKRSREQIQADLLASMRQRQAAIQAGVPVSSVPAVGTPASEPEPVSAAPTTDPSGLDPKSRFQKKPDLTAPVSDYAAPSGQTSIPSGDNDLFSI